jgi:protein involved in polysaccharide export with SLBB domain
MLSEVQKRLANGYVEFPIVSVSLRQTRSKKYTIYGQVTRPGGYPVEEGMTILRAITDAGGFIVPGSTGRVKILRPKPGVKESEVITFDIAAILNGANQNVKVLPGDTIVVSVDKFFIYGQVLRPGAYPVEENMTILHAVTLAGGFIESGSTGKVKLFRPKTKDREAQLIESGINAILKGTKQNAVVLSGDTIVVTLDKFFISGQVNRPGAYPVEENMTLLSAVTQAGGFAESGSTGKVKLLRPKAGSKESQAIESDIAAILNGGNQNVAVLPGDSIVVSSDKFFVYGEVVRPGMYPLEASASTLTAISMAGGFTKFGAANRVKVMRINEATGAYDQIKVNINDVMAGDSKADVILKPRDIVVVSEGMF